MTPAMTRVMLVLRIGAVLVILLLPFSDAEAGTKVVVGRTAPAGQQVSMDSLDHSSWDALLKKYVDADGDVNYANWKKTEADVKALDAYLADLSRGLPGKASSRPAQFAYWINAYNAMTIKGILREYPTTSIRNHTAKVWGYNIWDDLLLITPNGNFSLNHIEHEILRKMGDARIHFAIVCASKGCPRLLNQAYTSSQLDKQLTANARHFFSDRQKFKADVDAKRIYVSPILEWFAEDFGSSDAQQMRFIATFLPDLDAQRLARSGSADVSYLDYDWNLNEKPGGSRRR
ncbi:MAG: DUF547 domain-containing protein [Pirellulales bacterium]|nr:DUF547 domain-containing protein [Pirellulales bacterium]